MIEQSIEEVAEAMEDHPIYWAALYLQLKQTTEQLIQDNKKLRLYRLPADETRRH